MLNAIISFLGIVLVFGIVIFVHELGHFLAAKAVGVYAPRFSIGFGPALWRTRRGETEYVIAALPLGGYVRMASRHDDATAWIEGGGEGRDTPAAVATVGADGAAKLADEEYPEGWDPEAMRPFGPKPIPEDRWFESKPLWARLVILLAGVTMNIVLALVLLIGLFAVIGEPIVATRVVGAIADTTAAGRALATAVAPGDTIEAVNGRPVATWADIEDALAEARDSVRITTNRGEATIRLTGGLDGSDLAAAMLPAGETVIDSPRRGSAAERAGLRTGDRVVAVDGEPIRSSLQFVRRIQESPGEPVVLTIERDGARREIVVVPDSATEPAAGGGPPRVVGRIGVGLVSDFETAYRPIPFRDAVRTGWERTWQMGGLIFTTLRRLGSGDVPLRELGGPGTIAVASARAAQAGLAELVGLIALLSVNVAIFNLLPIPLLDGGQIVLNVVEAVKGSEFSPRTREFILRIGLAAILLLFAIVLFNDTSLLVGLFRGIWN